MEYFYYRTTGEIVYYYPESIVCSPIDVENQIPACFRFSDEFRKAFLQSSPPIFGYDDLGIFLFYSKYSIVKPDGTNESFKECILRVVEGIMSVRKHYRSMNDVKLAEKMCLEFASMRSLPSEQMLKWCGTPTMYSNGSATICDTVFLKQGFSESMGMLVDFLLFGSNVVCTVENEKIHIPTKEVHVQIHDSREGWSSAVQLLIEAYTSVGIQPLLIDRITGADSSKLRGCFPIFDFSKVEQKHPNSLLKKLIDAILLFLNSSSTTTDGLETVIREILTDKRHCLAKGTLVFTKRGIIEIENVRIGDSVLSIDNQFTTVTNTFIQGRRNVIKIYTTDGMIECTPDHKILVFDEESADKKWIEADSILPKRHYLLSPRCELDGENNLSSSTDDWFSGLIWGKDSIQDLGNGIKQLVVRIDYNRQSVITFLKNYLSGATGCYFFTHPGNELIIIQNLLLIEKWNVNPMVLSLKRRKFFLAGVFSRIGCIYNNQISWGPNNKDKLNQLRLMIMSCGWDSQLDSNTIFMTNESHMKDFWSELNSVYSHEQATFSVQPQFLPRIEDNYVTSQVTRIVNDYEQRETFDIECETHSFVANGFIVHNSSVEIKTIHSISSNCLKKDTTFFFPENMNKGRLGYHTCPDYSRENELSEPEHGEIIMTADVLLPRCYDGGSFSRDLFFNALYYATLCASTMTLMMAHYKSTNYSLKKNRRIGIHLNGIATIYRVLGYVECVQLLREGYDYIRKINHQLNSEMNIPDSIRVTTIRYSDVASMAGIYADVFLPEHTYSCKNYPVSIPMKKFLVSQDYMDVYPGPVTFHVYNGKYVQNTPIFEKVAFLELLQREWADNSIDIPIEIDDSDNRLECYIVSTMSTLKKLILYSYVDTKTSRTLYKKMKKKKLDWMQYRKGDDTIAIECMNNEEFIVLDNEFEIV